MSLPRLKDSSTEQPVFDNEGLDGLLEPEA